MTTEFGNTTRGREGASERHQAAQLRARQLRGAIAREEQRLEQERLAQVKRDAAESAKSRASYEQARYTLQQKQWDAYRLHTAQKRASEARRELEAAVAAYFPLLPKAKRSAALKNLRPRF